jgi:hypothetical protein
MLALSTHAFSGPDPNLNLSNYPKTWSFNEKCATAQEKYSPP